MTALADELTSAGRDVVGVQADVTVPGELERFVTQSVGRFGRIDALVNNAGTAAAGASPTATRCGRPTSS